MDFMRLGPRSAKTAAMQDGKTVQLVKKYDRPDFNTKPTLDDKRAKDRLELKMLRMDMNALKDQQRRLREEIEDCIKMLTLALEENRAETAEQVKRRISRLKGALEYRGRCDYTMVER